MSSSHGRVAGILLFIAAAQYMISELLAESVYPGYSISHNFISDLGATCRGGACQIIQPSANIFNASVFSLGALVIVSVYYVRRATGKKIFQIVLSVGGIGAMGVGIFPETSGSIHVIFSLITFLFAGLSSISSYWVVRPPFRYLCVLLGLVTIVSMILFAGGFSYGLGRGGDERMITYPTLIWLIAFGGYLMVPVMERSTGVG